MIKEITSLQNSFIKKIGELKSKKYRQIRKEFIVEGVRSVEEAVKSEWTVKSILFTDNAFKRNERLAQTISENKDFFDVYKITDDIERKLSDTDNPQGIMAIVEEKEFSLGDFEKKEGLILVLDEVRDPGNLGTIIRTSDAASALGVVVLENSVDLYSPKVIRSTMGSIFHLPVVTGVTKKDLCLWAKEHKFSLWGSALEGGEDMHKIDWPSKVALVMGSEAHGINKDFLKSMDKKVFIPMTGNAESLNVAVASGILLFEGQYRQKLRVN